MRGRRGVSKGITGTFSHLEFENPNIEGIRKTTYFTLSLLVNFTYVFNTLTPWSFLFGGGAKYYLAIGTLTPASYALMPNYFN